MFLDVPFFCRSAITQAKFSFQVRSFIGCSTPFANFWCNGQQGASRQQGARKNDTSRSQSRGFNDDDSLTGNIAGCVSEVSCSPVGKYAPSSRSAVSPLLEHVFGSMSINHLNDLSNRVAHILLVLVLLVLALIILLAILLPTGAGG